MINTNVTFEIEFTLALIPLAWMAAISVYHMIKSAFHIISGNPEKGFTE